MSARKKWLVFAMLFGVLWLTSRGAGDLAVSGLLIGGMVFVCFKHPVAIWCVLAGLLLGVLWVDRPLVGPRLKNVAAQTTGLGDDLGAQVQGLFPARPGGPWNPTPPPTTTTTAPAQVAAAPPG